MKTFVKLLFFRYDINNVDTVPALFLSLIIWLTFLLICLVSCNGKNNPYDKGSVEYLPKGDYIIWNTGSRHIVKCVDVKSGNYYWLNDSYFNQNHINGYDAHQYREKTKIKIN